ncbi:hypothetical protein ATETN484_0003024200 [Aspergillus terreus]|nr:hypothetical protein ATETN484_0003024200 [Aspergillus terreus]
MTGFQKEEAAAEAAVVVSTEPEDEYPMDEGLQAWLQVLGSWILFANTCTTYWQVLLAQGICTGLGSGLLGLTSVAVIPLYFQKKRMIATGIAATGSSLAGIIYPIMLRRLFVQIGFPWAVRALTFLILGCLIVACLVMKLRPRSSKGTTLIELRHFRDFPYVVFIAAFTLMISSVYIPFFYIQKYALQLGIDEDMAFYLLSMMNATSLIGRIGPNWLADRYGGVNVMAPACFLSAVTLFLWRFTHSLPGLIVIVLLYGLISGGMVSLPPATIANLTSKQSELGGRMGLAYTIAAFGALIGNPIAGACLRPSGVPSPSVQDIQSEFQGTWIFAGAIMLLATACLVLTRYLQFGFSRGNKI